jgi:hypothetical protein
MRFVETHVFTRSLKECMTDHEYHSLQLALIFRPEIGSAIPGSGGLRKLRWSVRGKGKRGGLRVIYFWHPKSETFYMLYVFEKNKQEDLTRTQVRLLNRLVREEFK